LLKKHSTQQPGCQVGGQIGAQPGGQALKTAWGDFVDQVVTRKGTWDWFATLTFRDKTPREAHTGWSKVGWGYSEKACNQFLRHVGELKGLQDLWWFRAREYQTWRGVPHWHLLIGGVGDVRRDESWSWWFQRYGFARILPYDSSQGARFYLCKYVTKDLGDFKFSDNLSKAISGINLTKSQNVL
jgi:hypothetical protein